jgi:opacity protein-like surface antigen
MNFNNYINYKNSQGGNWMIKAIAALLIGMVALGVGDANAQQRVQFKIGYNTGMPLGNFKEFIGKNSFRGFRGELRLPVSERLKVGLGVSYNDYYEKLPRQIYETKDGTISAVVSNSIQTTPIQLKASYDLTTGTIRPYVGLGAGGNLVSYAQYLGEFGNRESKFKLSATAEAGLTIPFNKQTRSSGLDIGAHFNYMPYNRNNLNNLNNWGIHAAVFFPLKG